MRLTSPTLLGVVLCAGQLVAAELGKAGAQQAIAQGNGNERKDKANGEGKGPLTEEFRKYVDGLLEEWHVPGFAIGVVDGDDTWTEVPMAQYSRLTLGGGIGPCKSMDSCADETTYVG